MSRFGETADKILETLHEGNIRKSELQKKVCLKDAEISISWKNTDLSNSIWIM